MNGSRALRWTTPLTLLVVALLLFPIVIAVVMSFTSGNSLSFPPPGFSLRWYRAVFTNPDWTTRIPVSFKTALGTAALATALGGAAAVGLSRCRSRLRGPLFGLFIAPLIAPVVVLGAGEYFVEALGWKLGGLSFGGHMLGTVDGLIFAHTVLAIPFPTVLILNALQGLDPDLDRAAASLGAGPWRRFLTVTAPLIAPAVFAGLVFAFLASWDEVVMASFLTTSQVSTVPVQIFTDLRQALDPAAAAISSMLLGVAALLLILIAAVRKLTRNRRSKGWTTA